MNAVKKASKTKGSIGLAGFCAGGAGEFAGDPSETLTPPYVQPIVGAPLVLKQAARSGAMLIRIDIITENLRPGSVADFSDNVEMRGRKNLE